MVSKVSDKAGDLADVAKGKAADLADVAREKAGQVCLEHPSRLPVTSDAKCLCRPFITPADYMLLCICPARISADHGFPALRRSRAPLQTGSRAQRSLSSGA